MVRFSCLPSVRPLSLLGHRITTAHHLPSVARDRVGRGSSAPVCRTCPLSATQAPLFHHVCIHHQLAAHIDASTSVCHRVHHWRRKTEESTIPALGGESHIKTTFKQCGIRKVLKTLLSSYFFPCRRADFLFLRWVCQRQKL